MVLDLPEFDTLLNETGDHFTSGQVSESHGVACGLLCRSPASGPDDFIGLLAVLHLLHKPEPQVSQVLGQLFEVCRSQLEDDEFRFELCLPPEEDSLEDRTAALAQWCTGFLAGLGSGDSDVFESSSDEVTEALSDLAQIARAELGGGDDIEEEETALTEIIEYLRIVTFMMREELRPASPEDLVH